ncbi:MAG: BsuPI-related putative proteinase inhibitor [Calditrichaceae bacterium]
MEEETIKYNYVFLLISLLIISACTSATDLSFNNSETRKSIQRDGSLFTLTIPRASFNSEDSLQIQFEVKYIVPGQKSYVFPNIQQFGFRLTDHLDNTVMYYPGFFLPAVSRFTLGTGESKTFEYSGEFKDPDGHYIDSGEYKLSAYLMGNYPEVTLEIVIN